MSTRPDQLHKGFELGKQNLHLRGRGHPVSEFHFCFNWGLRQIGCHTQVGSTSTILTTFLSFWYRKFTFWYYSQNFVSIKWPHPKLAPSWRLNRCETPGTGWLVINWYWQFRLFSPLSTLNTEPIKFGGETVIFCHNESDGTTFFLLGWVRSTMVVTCLYRR